MNETSTFQKTSKHNNTQKYSSSREIYPQRPRQYNASEFDSTFRPVSPEPTPSTRADAQPAVAPSSPAPYHSEHSRRPGTLFSLAAPTPTYLWFNVAVPSRMQHDPVPLTSWSSGEERTSSPSMRHLGRMHTPNNTSVAFPIRRLPVDSDTSPPIFDIGFPPRQDHRSSFAVRHSHSIPSSHQETPLTSSTEHFVSSPVTARHARVQMLSSTPPNRAWESHAIEIGGTKYWKCTWFELESEGPCNFSGIKATVKRHVKAHLKIHTGETPYGCKYNCGKSFGDPAKRSKHYYYNDPKSECFGKPSKTRGRGRRTVHGKNQRRGASQTAVGTDGQQVTTRLEYSHEIEVQIGD
ncbi:hypothetical protein K438DRAFT_1750725 [Mycena galopus ATCC 62051]|nr:hypothetical protein K438DRAFT_1750725 [Mycena galopus ATCC 62051]